MITISVAFEPLPPAFARLKQSLATDWGGAVPPHVTLRPKALSDHTGMVMLSVPRIDGALQEEWASIAKDYAALRVADPVSRQSRPGRYPCCALTMWV